MLIADEYVAPDVFEKVALHDLFLRDEARVIAPENTEAIHVDQEHQCPVVSFIMEVSRSRMEHFRLDLGCESNPIRFGDFSDGFAFSRPFRDELL